MKRWTRGVNHSIAIWGIQYQDVIIWDDRIGFRISFLWGSYYLIYSSKGARS